MAQDKSRLVVGLALIASLGGLLFGYDTAVISGAVAAIDHNFIEPRGLSEAARDSLSGWAVSCALLGCVIGAGVGGPIANRLGRKGGLMAAAILFLVGSLGSAVPELGLGPIGGMGPAALTPFILYRILGGVGVGLASMLAPMYIAEIAPPTDRGRLVTLQQIAIVAGITLVYFVNWAIALQGNESWGLTTGWRWMLASEAIPAAIFLLLLLLVPDSPRWLVFKGREDQALAVLRRISDDAVAKLTLAEIHASLVEKTRPLFSFGGKVIFVGIMLSVFQQFIGINAVLYYGPQMFRNAGFSTNIALFQTIVVGIALVAFTLVALVTVDHWGRKPLLVAGAIIMAVSMFALGLLFDRGVENIWPLAAAVTYIAGFSLSWGPVTWVLLAEIFPNSIKGKAMAIAVAAQWIANLFVSWSFKILDGSSALNAMFHHGFAYWVYAAMSLLAALFVLRFVPETKRHSLEAIQQLWSRPVVDRV
ncbi:MAG TPA: D-xylose transporter XylE [Rhizomicrobium sp.]|nr:D-xylose transporter XylE [Rhizomicrobium sp.]